jgi:hypothetical protein
MKKGLAKRREERFASATELAEALAAAASGAVQASVQSSEPERPTLSPSDEATCEPLYHSQAAPDPTPRRRQTWLALAAGALLVALIVGIMILRGGSPGAGDVHPAAQHPTAPEPPVAREHGLTPKAQSPARAAAAAASGSAGLSPALPLASAQPAPAASAPAPVAVESRPLNRAVRKPAAKPARDTQRTETVQKRANELWNKKDEL